MQIDKNELTAIITRLEDVDRNTSMLYLKASASGMTIVREDESNIASVDEVLGRTFFDMKEAEAIVLMRRSVGELIEGLKHFMAVAEAGETLAKAVQAMKLVKEEKGHGMDCTHCIEAEGWNDAVERIDAMRDAALSAYHSATRDITSKE